MKYFENFPLIQYYFSETEKFVTVNIFIKLKIIEYLRNNPALIQLYSIVSAERPDIIAHKIYGDSNLHWVILLANNVVDPDEWVLSEKQFEQYVNERYENKFATAFFEKDGEPADIRAHQKMLTDKPFNTIDSNPDPSFADPVTFKPVSFVEYEERKNNSKKVIKVVRPDRIVQFLKDIEATLRAIQ